MTQLEANKILETLNSKDWSNLYVVQNETWKKNSWFYINDIVEFSFVKDIIYNDLKSVNKSYKCSEWLTLLIYEKDDFFGLHKDEYLETKDRTVFTGGYLLNDDYEGGEFMISGEKLEVGVGELFMFDRKHEHEIKPLKSGMRYALHFGVQIKNSLTLI
jgi:hypothetical protein